MTAPSAKPVELGRKLRANRKKTGRAGGDVLFVSGQVSLELDVGQTLNRGPGAARNTGLTDQPVK